MLCRNSKVDVYNTCIYVTDLYLVNTLCLSLHKLVMAMKCYSPHRHISPMSKFKLVSEIQELYVTDFNMEFMTCVCYESSIIVQSSLVARPKLPDMPRCRERQSNMQISHAVHG